MCESLAAEVHPFGVATYNAAYNYHVRSVEFDYDNGATDRKSVV